MTDSAQIAAKDEVPARGGMKGLFKDRLNEILFTLYMCFVTFSFVYVYVTEAPVALCAIAIISFAAFFALSIPLFGLIRRIPSSGIKGKEITFKRKAVVFAAFSAVCFAVMMIWFAAFFPGSFGIDAADQFGQVVTGQYTNVHPAWHTMVFYTIPLKIFRWRKWSIVGLQMLYFSLTLGYLCLVLYKYASLKAAVVACLYIVLNPWIGFMMLCPMKDVAFAIAGALCMIMAAEAYLSRGAWGDRLHRCALLGIMLANATIFRHNGILFTFFLMLSLVFVLKKKQWIVILAFFIGMYAVVKGPVYDVFNVDESPQATVQIVGLPMTVLAGVAEHAPDTMDEETRDFIYSVAPADRWHDLYYLGNFCGMKYAGGIDEQVIEDTGKARIAMMALKSFTYAPGVAFKELFALTDIVYGLDLEDQGKLEVGTPDNPYGLYTKYDRMLAPALRSYYDAVKLGGYGFLRQSACAVLIMLAVILARLKFNFGNDRRLMLMCLPIFAYDFGTMLLLTWADARFFFITFPVCPVVILLALSRPAPEDEEQPENELRTVSAGAGAEDISVKDLRARTAEVTATGISEEGGR